MLPKNINKENNTINELYEMLKKMQKFTINLDTLKEWFGIMGSDPVKLIVKKSWNNCG